jgi:hypothetical protein
MALSIGGSKGKSKNTQSQTMNQTTTSAMTPQARALLMGRLDEIKGQSYQALDPKAYEAYMSPYQDEVIDAATADINAARGVAATGQRAAALARGPKGLSDRRGVYEAELDGQYDRTLATTTAGLRQAGYGQAVGIAQNENTNTNAFNVSLQDRITQLLALLAGDRVNTTSGSSSGVSTGKQSGMNFGFTYGGGA